MSPSADHSSASVELAQRSYNQALELEKQLRVVIQAKGPFDSNVRALWSRIRESYEAVILQDHEFAELHDVEQALWRLHYKRIEEFRARIRKMMGAMGVGETAANIPPVGSGAATKKEPLQKLQAFFRSFLSEATGFYHDLIMKIRAKYSLSQEHALFQVELQWPRDEKVSAVLKLCQLSCHRCLIFLGDLARYRELHGERVGRSRDWSVAAGYYLKAASLWPSSGNPHNQLAVLATYVGDELLAVYQYFRSLAVDSPFLTARENLVLLFEKNRQHYGKFSSLVSHRLLSLSKLDGSKAAGKESITIGDKLFSFNDTALKLASKDENKNETDLSAPAVISEIRKAFRIRFVRLNGILFMKTSLEIFPEVYSATMRDLEQLLACEDSSLESGLGLDHRSGIGGGSGGAAGVIQLVSVLIFSVHNINWGHDAHQPTYAEILQRSALFQNAFTATFECLGRLMRRCAEAEDVSASPLLPAMLVFLEWLACSPEIAIGSEMDEKQASARSFFWRQVAALLNILIKKEKEHNHLVGGIHCVSSGLSNGARNDCGLALWEDFELRGFAPLIPAQLALDYSGQPSRLWSGNKEERRVRTQRILGAGKAVANILEESGKGLCYDVEWEEFFIVGENREKKVKEPIVSKKNDTGILRSKGIHATDKADISVPPLNESLANGFSKVVPEKQNLETRNFFSRSSSGEEEDEELIVFRPLSVANRPSALPELLVHTSSMHKLSTVGTCGGLPENSSELEDLKSIQSAPGISFSKTFTSTLSMKKPMDSVIEQSRSSSPFVSTAANPAQETLAASVNSVNGSLAVHTSPSGLNVPSSTVGKYNVDSPKMDAKEPALATAANCAVDLVNFSSGPWHATYNAFSSSLDKSSARVAAVHSSWSSELESLARSGMKGLELSGTDDGLFNKVAIKAVMGSPGMLTAVEMVGRKIIPISSMSLNLLPNEVCMLPSAGDYNFLGSVGQAKIKGSVSLPAVSVSDSVYAATLGAHTGGAVDSAVSNTPSNLPALHGSVSGSGLTSCNGSWARPLGMQPPPAFGPFPTAKPVSKAELEHEGVSQSLDNTGEGEEQQVVDDYRWLDEETTSQPTNTESAYQRPRSLSPSYGVWPSALSTSGAVAYPFPGMGSSPHHGQQNTLQQFQKKLLIQNQHGAHQLQFEIQNQQQEQQHLLLPRQQKQLQQPTWFGQYRSQNPSVS